MHFLLGLFIPHPQPPPPPLCMLLLHSPIAIVTEGPVTHIIIPSRTSSAQKMKNFGQCVVIRWAYVRIRLWFDDNAGWTLFIYCVRQALRTFSAFSKMWAFFHVWMHTPQERQTSAILTLGTSKAHALNSLCFCWPRFVPVTCKRRTVHTIKNKKIKFESGLWKTSQAGCECTVCFQRKGRMNSDLLTLWTHKVRIKP